MVLVSATAPELISHGRNLDICNGMGSGLTWNRLEISVTLRFTGAAIFQRPVRAVVGLPNH